MKRSILIALFFICSQHIFAQDNINSTDKNLVPGKNASIANKTGGSISIDEITSAKMLILSDNLKSTYHIISFKLTIVSAAAPQVFENEENGQLTQVMLNAIKNALPGYKLYFESIKVAKASNQANTRKTIETLSFVLQ